LCYNVSSEGKFIMNMKRRNFFKTIGGLTGGLLLSTSTSAFTSAEDFKKSCCGINLDNKFRKLLRKQFLLPRDYTYLNTGGLGASPYMVTNIVKKMMDREEAYPNASHNEKDWLNFKEKCAAIMGKNVSKDELAFTSTATEGINIIVNGLPLNKKDEIIISTHEHVALKIPLLNRQKNDGIVIKTFEPDLQDAEGNVKRIEKLITKRTRLIFTSHITCTTGQIMPIKAISRLAKSRGILFALDGAQAIGHMPIDIAESGVDFYAYSGHKWIMGPKRTGVLYIRKDLLDTIRPITVGAYSTIKSSMEKQHIELHPTAQRYEFGTQNEALFCGLAEAVDFIDTIGIPNIQRYNRSLAESFYEELKKIRDVEIISPTQKEYRSAMISFRMKNLTSDKICYPMDKKRIRVRNVTEHNIGGVRVSFHIYNSQADINRLIDELKILASG
jgi:selenocysteine lyase/cysteine desulfurase